MADDIKTIEGSLVQHGHHNDRIYVMHLNTQKMQRLISELDGLAEKNGYGKIFAKIPASCLKTFEDAGYITEVLVPGLYNGTHDGLFVAKFFSAKRQETTHLVDYAVMEPVSAGGRHPEGSTAPVAACGPGDAGALSSIYRLVFQSYAFPIHRPDYLTSMMRKNTIYFCIRIDQKIAAAAAAEIDATSMSCEMTDFATLPEYRGHGLARTLLSRLDEEALARGIKTAYTIARADSQGMNRVFQANGYRYAGRLIKNTQIGGRIRSMAVWYKRLR